MPVRFATATRPADRLIERAELVVDVLTAAGDETTFLAVHQLRAMLDKKMSWCLFAKMFLLVGNVPSNTCQISSSEQIYANQQAVKKRRRQSD